MSHKQFISTKNPQKWPPFVVKTYRVTPLVKPLAAFFSILTPPWLPSAGSREKCRSCTKVLSVEESLKLPRAVAATPRHMGWDENTRFHRGKKKLRFSSGRRSWMFFGVWGKGKVAVQLEVSFLVPEIETSWKLRTVFAIKVLSPALVKAVILRSLDDYSDYRFTSSSGCLSMSHACHFQCWRESTWLLLVMTIMISLMSSCVLIICF